ncbi:MAG: DUF4388 domain-containing protein [Myxococcota bacterium]
MSTVTAEALHSVPHIDWLPPHHRDEVLSLFGKSPPSEKGRRVLDAISLWAAGAVAVARRNLDEVASDADDQELGWVAQHFIARTSVVLGDPSAVGRALSRAESFATKLGQDHLARTLVLGAECHLRMADTNKAQHSLHRAQRMSSGLENPAVLASMDVAAAHLSYHEGQLHDAHASAHRAVARGSGYGLGFLATLALKEGRLDSARELFVLASRQYPSRSAVLERDLVNDLLNDDDQTAGTLLSIRDRPSNPLSMKRLQRMVQEHRSRVGPRLVLLEQYFALNRLSECKMHLDAFKYIATADAIRDRVAIVEALSTPNSGRSPDSTQMLSGTLSHFKVPDLLSFLANGRFTGELELTRPGHLVKCSFESGVLDGVCSAEAMAHPRGRFKDTAQLASVLTELGEAPEHVEASTKDFALNVLSHVIKWTDGTFACLPHPDGSERPRMRLDVHYGLLEAARRDDERSSSSGRTGLD